MDSKLLIENKLYTSSLSDYIEIQPNLAKVCILFIDVNISVFIIFFMILKFQ